MLSENKLLSITNKYAETFGVDREDIFSAVRTIAKTFPAPEKEPRFLCIAGLSGSGKTGYCKSEELYKSYFVLDPDEYRKYCKGYGSMTSKELIEKTQTTINAVGLSLLEAALTERISVAVSGTFVNYPFWEDVFSRHREILSEYKREMILIAAPYGVCKDAMELRFRRELSKADTVARMVDVPFLKKSREGFAAAVKKYRESGFFESYSLLARYLETEDCRPCTKEGDILWLWERITGEEDVE